MNTIGSWYIYIYWIISLFQGGWREYSESQVLQMAGRAGRPQFCDTATVVIMTEESMKRHYERLIGGTQLVESNLQKHLHQHLNAEIILGSEQYFILRYYWSIIRVICKGWEFRDVLEFIEYHDVINIHINVRIIK